MNSAFRLLLLVSLILKSVAGFAENSLTATVDRNAIELNASVILSLKIVSSERQDAEEPIFESNDFEQVERSSHSEMRSNYINGTFSSEYRLYFDFILKPKKTGVLVLRNIHAKLGDQTLRAPDISIHVLPAVNSSQPGASPSPPLSSSVSPGVGTDFFVRAEVSSNSVHLGERVFVSYYLYGRGSLTQVAGDKFPVLEGFLKEEISMPLITGDMRPQEVEVQGKRYARYLLAQYSATPLKTGTLKIDPLGVKVSYVAAINRERVDEDDLFSSLFRSSMPRTERLKADQKSIEVLPTPAQGKPESYSGLVGDFTAIWSVNSASVNTGQPFKLVYKIEGSGSLAGLKWPGLNLPEGIEVLETKTKGSSSATGVDVKIFESTLLARKPGDFVISPVRISSFSPTKKAYYINEVEPIQIQALGLPVDPVNGPEQQTSSQGQARLEGKGAREKPVSEVFEKSGLAEWARVLWPSGFLVFLTVGVLVLGFFGLRIMGRSRSLGLSFSRDELAKASAYMNEKRQELRLAPQDDLTLEGLQTLCEQTNDRFEAALQRALKRSILGDNSERLLDGLVSKFNLGDGLIKKLEKGLDFRDWLKYSNQAGRDELDRIRKNLEGLLSAYSDVLVAILQHLKEKQ